MTSINHKARLAFDTVKEIHDSAKEHRAHVPEHKFRRAMCALNEQGMTRDEIERLAGSVGNLRGLQRGDITPEGPERDRLVHEAGKLLRNKIIPRF